MYFKGVQIRNRLAAHVAAYNVGESAVNSAAAVLAAAILIGDGGSAAVGTGDGGLGGGSCRSFFPLCPARLHQTVLQFFAHLLVLAVLHIPLGAEALSTAAEQQAHTLTGSSALLVLDGDSAAIELDAHIIKEGVAHMDLDIEIVVVAIAGGDCS